jgi:5'-3' exonuclease
LISAGRQYDLERVVDDFVLLCYFVGNDFLPHLPTMDINTGGLNALIRIYKKLMPEWEGFLTDAGDVHLGRLEHLLKLVGKTETEMFKKRAIDQVGPVQPPTLNPKSQTLNPKQRMIWSTSATSEPKP